MDREEGLPSSLHTTKQTSMTHTKYITTPETCLIAAFIAIAIIPIIAAVILSEIACMVIGCFVINTEDYLK